MASQNTSCGAAEADPPTFDVRGDPAAFDPRQAYVHGHFRGSERAIDAFAEECDDGGMSGIADWSSAKDDWHTKDGITVALPCDIRDLRTRIDGSITYELAPRFVRAFVQDAASIRGSNIDLGSDPESRPIPEWGDPELLRCGNSDTFRHWLHPATGTIVAFCVQSRPNASSGDPVEEHGVLAIPAGWGVLHLGCEAYVLVQRLDSSEALGVWSPDGLVEIETPMLFEASQIAAVRARRDGFALLIVEEGERRSPLQPRALLGVSLWHFSYAGKLTRGSSYPPVTDATLDASRCPLRSVPPFVSGEPLPPLTMDYLGSAGCFCALESTGAALCNARERGAPVVLRFDPGAANAEIVFRTLDDPFLIDIKGLITGP